MSPLLLYGKPCTEHLAESIANSVTELGFAPKLYTIGFDNEQWLQYTTSLAKSATRYSVEVQNITVSQDILPEEFFKLVKDTCANADCSGVMLQQPLPTEFKQAVNFVDVSVDVDCQNPLTCAKLYYGQDGFRPATAQAVINLLDFYNIELQGKNVVIVGRGNAVGKPLALMMIARNATVTVCHTKTKNLAKVCQNADILISACGKARLITSDFVNNNTIVVDVGLSFVGGKSCGDVSPEVYDICAGYSPVPGGVGPVTRATLFENLIKAAKGDR